MNSHVVASCLLIATLATPSSAVEVVGHINAPTVWTKANSPYVLTGDVTVAAHASLTIEPGVVVQAAATDEASSGSDTAKVELIVLGTLFADGELADPIVFRGPTDASASWVGLVFAREARTSSLTHAEVRGARIGLHLRATNPVTLADVLFEQVRTGVHVQTSGPVRLERVRVRMFDSIGVLLESADEVVSAAAVVSSVVYGGLRNSTGIHVGAQVNATIEATHVVAAEFGVDMSEGSSLSLSNCVLAGNFQMGARLRQAAGQRVSLLHNTFDDNRSSSTGVGVQVEKVSDPSSFVVRNNLISRHQIGMRVVGSPAPTHDHNNVWGGAQGRVEYQGTTAGVGSVSSYPLYVRAVSEPAPEPWTLVTAPFFASGSDYSVYTRTFDQVGGGWMRMVIKSFTRGASASLAIRDRAGATIQTLSSTLSTPFVSNAGLGPQMTLRLDTGSNFSSVTVTGYEWAPLTWNYRLKAGSPAIDQGAVLDAWVDDPDGTPRPYDGDFDGSAASDMGAYEWHENVAPTARAGVDRTVLPDTEVSFDAVASFDADGEIVSYLWDFGGGATADTAKAKHTFASVGDYSVTLTVTDNLGQTASDTLVITVSDNRPPSADAGPDQNAEIGQVLTFDASASTDDDGAIVAYEWDFGDGTLNGLGPIVTHSFARRGVFEVTLTVSDERDASASTKIYVVVGGGGIANVAPVAEAGPARSVVLGEPVTLDASGSSDSDGALVSYLWRWGDDTAEGSGLTATHTYASAGTYMVKLTVTDDRDASATDVTIVTVTAPANAAPVADAGGPYTGTVGQPMTLDGSASTDINGSVASWSWDFGDGQTAEGVVVTHTYAAGGSYLVRLIVSDDQGATAADVVLANVAALDGNLPPVAKAGGHRIGNVNEELVFEAEASTDADGEIVAWAWDFGDGATADTGHAVHAFTQPGAYLVKLTVTDDHGAIGQDLALVTIGAVTEGNTLPVAVAGENVAAHTGQRVVFNAADSGDADGHLIAWLWDFGDGSTGSGISATHVYEDGGLYLVTLTVIDDDGAIATSTLSARINARPTAQIAGSAVIRVGQELTLDASRSEDADGTIAGFHWTFGDGEAADGATVSHAWASAGSYLVTLQVVDNEGGQSDASLLVTVSDVVIAADGCGCGSGSPVSLLPLLMLGAFWWRRRLR